MSVVAPMVAETALEQTRRRRRRRHTTDRAAARTARASTAAAESVRVHGRTGNDGRRTTGSGQSGLRAGAALHGWPTPAGNYIPRATQVAARPQSSTVSASPLSRSRILAPMSSSTGVTSAAARNAARSTTDHGRKPSCHPAHVESRRFSHFRKPAPAAASRPVRVLRANVVRKLGSKVSSRTGSI